MIRVLAAEPIGSPNEYRTDDGTLEALQSLAARPGDATPKTLLCSFGAGNRAPAVAGVRVVAGHSPGTVRLQEKLADVRSFFDAATPDADRIAILAKHRVTHVLVGPIERNALDAPFGTAKASYDPGRLPGARSTYRRDGVEIYDVTGVQAP